MKRDLSLLMGCIALCCVIILAIAAYFYYQHFIVLRVEYQVVFKP